MGRPEEWNIAERAVTERGWPKREGCLDRKERQIIRRRERKKEGETHGGLRNQWFTARTGNSSENRQGGEQKYRNTQSYSHAAWMFDHMEGREMKRQQERTRQIWRGMKRGKEEEDICNTLWHDEYDVTHQVHVILECSICVIQILHKRGFHQKWNGSG